MTDTPEITVIRNDEHSRYEILQGDTVAGYTEFIVDRKGRLVFPHTLVDPAFSGQGLAKILVSRALADVAARGETVVPVCPYVVKFLRANTVEGLDVHWRPTADEHGSASVDAADR